MSKASKRAPRSTSTTAPQGNDLVPASSSTAPAAEVRTLEQHEVLVRPSTQNARVLHAWGRLGETDLNAIAHALREKSSQVIHGDMASVKAQLHDQAVSLQAIFTNLSIEAASSDAISRMEPLLRLALKAQNQSRATLETLAMIMNPPVVYAQQANIAAGPQQVNNGVPAMSPPAQLENSEPTELFEERRHGSRLDTGAPGAHGGVDPHLAPVGTLDRTEERRGQGAKPEQPVPRRQAATAARDDADAAGGAGRAARGARSPVKPKRGGGSR